MGLKSSGSRPSSASSSGSGASADDSEQRPVAPAQSHLSEVPATEPYQPNDLELVGVSSTECKTNPTVACAVSGARRARAGI